MLRGFWLLWPLVLSAQTAGPLIIGRPLTMLPPAIDSAGQRVAFGSAIAPDGAIFPATDVYVAAVDGSGLRRLTRFAGEGFPPQGAWAVSVSGAGTRVAFSTLPAGGRSEEVHVLDVATSADRVVAIDKEGCIQPLCPNCFLACVQAPHITPDGSRVVYSVARNEPFRSVNADGSGLTRLPVYSGILAPAPQRVMTRTGLLVFSSSAPAGPTFAASAWDLYLIGLDGANLRRVTNFGNDPSIFVYNAVISADGGTIAFETNRDPETGTAKDVNRVWTVRADGTGLRALTTGPEPSSSPSISADGRFVAFVQAGQIHLARSDGTGRRLLAGLNMSSAQDPVISDDGSRVVFTVGPRSGERGAIYSVAADGSGLRPVYAPRALNRSGVSGAVPGSAPSAGSLVTAYGTNLTPDGIIMASRFPLPESLAGLSLLVNGRVVPLLAVTPWQVNAQLPQDTPEGPAAFQFRFSDGTMAAAGAAEVKALAPAIFYSFSGGTCQAAVLHGGTGVPVDKEHPAIAGEALEIYGTGLGRTEPLVAAGMPAPASPPARAFRPEVQIGGRTAAVLFSGLTPGLAGVYQVNAVVPSGLRPGAYPVQWRAGNLSSSECGVIWVGE